MAKVIQAAHRFQMPHEQAERIAHNLMLERIDAHLARIERIMAGEKVLRELFMPEGAV